MMRALFSAISGMRNHMSYMDVVGNNISNVNTIAFKSSRVSFQDILGQTVKGANSASNGRGGTNAAQIGLGMTLGAIDNLMGQGSLQSTGKMTDIAVQGDGFFVLSDGSGSNSYTRDGSFDIATDGGLVSPTTGLRVMGWAANALGAVDTQQPMTSLNIPFGTLIPAHPSTTMKFNGNLDAGLPLTGAASSLNTTTSVFDTLGVPASVQVGFTHVAANTWAVTDAATSPAGAAFGAAPLGAGSSITGAPNDLRPGSWAINLTAGGVITAQFTPAVYTAGAPPNFAAGATPEPIISGTIAAGATNTTLIPGMTIVAPTVLAAVGPINFNVGITNQAVALKFTTGGQFIGTNPNVNMSVPNTTGAQTPTTVALDLTAFTQFSGATQIALVNQDGAAAGSLNSFSIGSSGEVSGIYSNGANRTIGQIALASFVNPGGLMRAGQNVWTSSANSGLPVTGAPNTGGRGTLSTGSLETSNVDLAQQFTNVIIAQRGFQSSSRVITASDQMLQDLVNIIR